jgi:tripartite-type tricarboxylate transporter receptor subunit TctC
VVFANKRHSAFPDVPTAKEFGFNLNLPNWRGLVAPAGTPKDRVDKLYSSIRQVLESDEYKKICQRQYKCVKPMDLAGVKKYAYDYYDQITKLMADLGLNK